MHLDRASTAHCPKVPLLAEEEFYVTLIWKSTILSKHIFPLILDRGLQCLSPHPLSCRIYHYMPKPYTRSSHRHMSCYEIRNRDATSFITRGVVSWVLALFSNLSTTILLSLRICQTMWSSKFCDNYFFYLSIEFNARYFEDDPATICLRKILGSPTIEIYLYKRLLQMHTNGLHKYIIFLVLRSCNDLLFMIYNFKTIQNTHWYRDLLEIKV